MLESFCLIVLWGTALLIIVSYGLYPLATLALSRFANRPADVPDEAIDWPAVTMIVPCYNEEGCLPAKIRNCLEIDYPGRFEVLFGDDASDDATPRILEAQAGEAVRWRRMPHRSGKVNVLNHLVHEAQGQVVVLSDANTLYAPDAVRHLVRALHRPGTGLVCGQLDLSVRHPLSCREEGRYWGLENALKDAEARMGWLASFNGQAMAFWKRHWLDIPRNSCGEDQYLGMTFLVRGIGVDFEPRARVEESAETARAEFRRRKRIAVGNYQNLFWFRSLLWRGPAGPVTAFVLHKVLRWIIPLLLPIVYPVSYHLAMTHPGGLHFGIFMAGSAVVFLGLVREAVPRRIRLGTLVDLCNYVIRMDLAFLLGLVSFVRGVQRSVWDRMPRLSRPPGEEVAH